MTTYRRHVLVVVDGHRLAHWFHRLRLGNKITLLVEVSLQFVVPRFQFPVLLFHFGAKRRPFLLPLCPPVVQGGLDPPKRSAAIPPRQPVQRVPGVGERFQGERQQAVQNVGADRLGELGRQRPVRCEPPDDRSGQPVAGAGDRVLLDQLATGVQPRLLPRQAIPLVGRGEAVGLHANDVTWGGFDGAPVRQNESRRLFGKRPLDPSREVDPRFVQYAVATLDGRTLTGVIAGETSTAVTLRLPEKGEVTILRADIEKLTGSGQSLMPENLLQGLSDPEVRGLFAYLRSSQPLNERKN